MVTCAKLPIGLASAKRLACDSHSFQSLKEWKLQGCMQQQYLSEVVSLPTWVRGFGEASGRVVEKQDCQNLAPLTDWGIEPHGWRVHAGHIPTQLQPPNIPAG